MLLTHLCCAVLWLPAAPLQPFAPMPEDRQVNSFSHVFAGGYAAGYYRSVMGGATHHSMVHSTHGSSSHAVRCWGHVVMHRAHADPYCSNRPSWCACSPVSVWPGRSSCECTFCALTTQHSTVNNTNHALLLCVLVRPAPPPRPPSLPACLQLPVGGRDECRRLHGV